VKSNEDKEIKEYDGIHGYRSVHGSSYGYITCPFCKSEVKVYIWSLRGGGKKCDCGAMLTSFGKAYKEKDILQKIEL
jgi:hypothetical protein